MSFLLAGLIVAGTSGAIAVGRWLSRRREAPSGPNGPNDGEPAGADGATGDGTTGEPRDPQDSDTTGGATLASDVAQAKAETAKREADAKADAAKKGAKKPVKRTGGGPAGGEENRPIAHLEGFPCQLGDVIMRITGEEAWLAGGLVLCEEGPVAALFVAPDAGHDCAIYVRPHPREAVFWMEPLDPGAVLVGGEPPSSVEHNGIRFDRARRLPLRPRRIGVGAPDVGDAVVLAEYASAGSERLLVMRSTSGVSRAFRGEELEPSTYEVIASGRSTLDDD